MIEKRADYKLVDAQPLNTPDFSESFIKDQGLKVDNAVYADTLQKIAASEKESNDKNSDAAEAPVFDLEAEISDHPDSLFIKCFAIKASETNDNGDYFSTEELKKATPTFVGVPLFTNHANSDINEARGKVVHSWWDHDKDGIMIIGRVDAAAYPQLARGIKEEYVVGTSMGCQVQYSLCSVCHNYAETPDQYCSCIRERKTRQIVARNQECKYHEQGSDDVCPICSSTKGKIKKYSVNTKVFEYNYGIKFIENSFVVNPACHDCGVTEVIDPSKLLAKMATLSTNIQAILPRLQKIASEEQEFCSDTQCIKTAGQSELDSLNQALDLLSSVSQSMLSQKEQLDLEFLSDLVKVLADLQTVVDELTEQGYGRLQSPGGGEEGDVQKPDGGPPNGEITQAVQPAQPANPTPGGGSKIQTGPAGQAGTVTGPMARIRRLQLEKLALKLVNGTEQNITMPDLQITRKKKENHVKLASKPIKKSLDLSFQMSKKKSKLL